MALAEQEGEQEKERSVGLPPEAAWDGAPEPDRPGGGVVDNDRSDGPFSVGVFEN